MTRGILQLPGVRGRRSTGRHDAAVVIGAGRSFADPRTARPRHQRFKASACACAVAPGKARSLRAVICSTGYSRRQSSDRDLGFLHVQMAKVIGYGCLLTTAGCRARLEADVLEQSLARLNLPVTIDGKTLTGAGVIIGLVDTGVDPSHPSIRGRILTAWDQVRDLAGRWLRPKKYS